MDIKLKNILSDKYDNILNKYGFRKDSYEGDINLIIKNSIVAFLSDCSNPAIWCYGQHTKMLIADFVFEMKSIKYFIDEKYKYQKTEGFNIIGSEDIKKLEIDAIIISSFKYRREILDKIRTQFPDIKVLDIYESLKRQGINLETEYYNGSHPYNLLQNLNRYIRNYIEVHNNDSAFRIEELLLKIKDFRLASKWACRFSKELDNNWDEFYKDVTMLYQLQLTAFGKIASSNVLMLCFDGLRQKDLSEGCMPNLKKYLQENTHYFTNAYSVSTSTFESLIPAYGGYKDFTKEYYKDNIVKAGDCAFINEAIKQNRDIFFYTDSYRFVEEPVSVTNYSQLATQKIWDFISDALGTDNGLFYLHILYETHYSYPNPYTENRIIADGSNICFDFIERNGGKLRTDYIQQHMDALRYIDDVIGSFLKRINFGVVFYADHGNVIYPTETRLEETRYTDYTFGQDLIRIPLAIKYAGSKNQLDEMSVCTDDRLVSLFSINDIVVSLLADSRFRLLENKYVKIQRTELYNPNFQYLMKKLNYEKGLNSFECYIFDDGYKLVIYGDGSRELYTLFDEQVEDACMMDEKLDYLHKK